MIFKNITLLFTFLFCSKIVAQDNALLPEKDLNFIGVGYNMGQTIPSISIFPETSTQKGLDISFGSTTFTNDTWAKLLNYPNTGVLVSIADFGNREKVGYSFAVMPFLDFGVFSSLTKRIRFQVGLGGSYNNVIYDRVSNPGNYGISTHLTWAFRSFVYYDLLQRKDFNLKIGGGVTHFSNGHTKLPNHGMNSFLASLKTEVNWSRNTNPIPISAPEAEEVETQHYYAMRLGLGQKVLARDYNILKNVYTSSFSMGWIKNRTYKYGLGFFYRFYDDYYDYIRQGGPVVTTEFPELKKNPFQNASALGLYADFEILMHHFSIETALGINLYKPAYPLDWYLNNGSYKGGVYQAKPYATKAQIKQVVASRLGFRYYAVTAKKAPQHNVFVAANINANLGQADFSEFSFGYVYCPPSFNKKKRASVQ